MSVITVKGICAGCGARIGPGEPNHQTWECQMQREYNAAHTSHPPVPQYREGEPEPNPEEVYSIVRGEHDTHNLPDSPGWDRPGEPPDEPVLDPNPEYDDHIRWEAGKIVYKVLRSFLETVDTRSILDPGTYYSQEEVEDIERYIAQWADDIENGEQLS